MSRVVITKTDIYFQVFDEMAYTPTVLRLWAIIFFESFFIP